MKNLQSLLKSTYRTFLTHKLLVGIIALAAYLRLYRIGDYLTFLGDEGRDVLVVKGILEGDLTLLGPRASAGDFYTGPIYYYMMTPFLWLFNLDPVGPAIMVAILGIATVLLVYLIGRRFFSETSGIVAALLYAISPIIISYSRSSWNPNPMPFFSLIILFFIYTAVKNTSWKLFLISGFLFGIAFQLHYIEIFFAVVIFLFVTFATLFLQRSQFKTKTILLKNLVNRYVLLLAGFIGGFSPFLAFEIKNGFPNIRTIFNFILFDNTPAEDVKTDSFFAITGGVFFRLFGRLLMRFPPQDQIVMNDPLWISFLFWGTIILSTLSVVTLFKIKDKLWLLLILTWLVCGVILFGFYKKPIYDYYFAFMFPLPFFLVGNLLKKVPRVNILISFVWYIVSVSILFHLKPQGYPYLENILYLIPIPWILFITFKSKLRISEKSIALLSSIVLFVLVVLNVNGYPFKDEPNRQKDQVRQISEFVLSKTNGEPFNFALITKGNSDHGYRYFFELAGEKPTTLENETVDPNRESVTDQLLVVCEDISCEPLGNSLWEVAGFGRAEIDQKWDISVVSVYRLVPYLNNSK